MVEGIRMQRLFRSRLRISIAERPSQPKGARHAAPLVASTVLPPGPVLSITGGPYNVTAGETAQFTGSANCSNPTCTYGWAVTCPPFLTIGSQTATAAGINASITTGPNNGTVTHQINTFGLATPLVCNVSFSGTGASPLKGGRCVGAPAGSCASCAWPCSRYRLLEWHTPVQLAFSTKPVPFCLLYQRLKRPDDHGLHVADGAPEWRLGDNANGGGGDGCTVCTEFVCITSFPGPQGAHMCLSQTFVLSQITPAPPTCGGANLTIIVGNPASARPASPSNIRAASNGAVCTAKRVRERLSTYSVQSV